MLIRCLLAALVSLSLLSGAAADVSFDRPVFENDMMLQRDKPVPIWGRAKPREIVTVTFGDAKAQAETGGDGKWLVKLPPLKAHRGQTLTATGSEGSEAKLTNVAVGEVWFCSGQSNMTLDVGASNNGKEEAAAADYPDIRYLDHLGWHVLSPKNGAHISAVGYYFARDIHKALDVPVAIIMRAQSMSAIQPWVPIETLHLVPELHEEYARNAKRYLDHGRQWLERSEKAFAEGKAIDRFGESDVTQAGNLYSSHVAGFRGQALRGFLWYQGESNTRDGAFYATRMRGLVEGWRHLWGDGELPFYFVQIGPFDADGDLPALWEAQLKAARSIPNTEVSHSNDLGYSVHPGNKQAVGQRLARIALTKTYGKQGIVYAGPRFKSHAVEGGAIRIEFEHIGSGLVSRDGKVLSHFEIAGADGVYVPAEALIDGQSVMVRSASVAKPVHARFAWSRDAVHNLSNTEGIPAYPFRTDPKATATVKR